MQATDVYIIAVSEMMSLNAAGRVIRLPRGTSADIRGPIFPFALCWAAAMVLAHAPRPKPPNRNAIRRGRAEQRDARCSSTTFLALPVSTTDPFDARRLAGVAVGMWKASSIPVHGTLGAGSFGAVPSPTSSRHGGFHAP